MHVTFAAGLDRSTRRQAHLNRPELKDEPPYLATGQRLNVIDPEHESLRFENEYLHTALAPLKNTTAFVPCYLKSVFSSETLDAGRKVANLRTNECMRHYASAGLRLSDREPFRDLDREVK